MIKLFLAVLMVAGICFSQPLPTITACTPDSIWMGGGTVYISKTNNIDTVWFGDSLATITGEGTTVDTVLATAYDIDGPVDIIVANSAGRDTLTGGLNYYRFNYTVSKIIDNGATNRVNQAYVGDGFAYADTTTYKAYVDSSIKARRGLMGDWNAAQGMRPMGRYDKFFNFYRVNLISPESGISATPAWASPDTFVVNTPLKGTQDKAVLGWTIDSLTDSLWNHVQSDIGDTLHWKFVSLNTTDYRNSGGKYATFGYLLGFADLLSHEISHSIHGLGDEYWGCLGNRDDVDHGLPNITNDANLDRWDRWVGYNDADVTLNLVSWHCGVGDTIGDTVRYYEGAYYADSGQYRPTNNSKTNLTWNTGYTVGWNAICREKIIHDIYSVVSPVDAISADTSGTITKMALTVSVIDTAVIKIDWYRNDTLILSDGGEVLPIDSMPADTGSFTITAHVYDEIIRHSNSTNATPDALDYIRDGDTTAMVVDYTWTLRAGNKRKLFFFFGGGK